MKNVYGATLTGNYLFLLEARSFIRRCKRAHRQCRKLVPAFQQRKKTLRRIRQINLSDGQLKSLFGFLQAVRDTGCAQE